MASVDACTPSPATTAASDAPGEAAAKAKAAGVYREQALAAGPYYA